MISPVPLFVLAACAAVLSVLANEKPIDGRTDFANIGCHHSKNRMCRSWGKTANCFPVDGGTYYAESVDPNGYLAGAYGQCWQSGGHLGGCFTLRPGLKFKIECDRSYDNGRSNDRLGLVIHAEVVETNGILTLNTRLDDGGGCNLPVTKNVGDDKPNPIEWEASGSYRDHCW